MQMINSTFAFQSITAGSHRLWTHRSYKASFPLRVFLMLTNCIAMEDSIFVWARDHRVHHKFSETPADPHDATRGFFFAHVSLNVFGASNVTSITA